MQYTYIIYKFIFPNNKIYIGQTIQKFNQRLNNYKSNINFKNRDNRAVMNAIRKYEWDNVEKEILCTVSEEFVDDAERYFIKYYNSLVENGQGYNIEDGGNKNKHLSEITKKKISKAQTGKYIGKNNPMFGVHRFGEDSPNYGNQYSDETKRKIGDANIGKTRSEEHKQKISKALKGKYAGKNNPMYGMCGENSPMYGKKHSKKSKEKISKSKQGQGNIPIDVYVRDNNEYVRTFESTKQASRELNLFATHITRVLKNKRKSAGGYIFKYNNGNI